MAVAMAIQIPDNTVSRYMLTDMGCQVLVEVAFAGHVIISAAVSAFVAARIMALWSRNWYLGVFLFLVGLINWSPYVQSVLVGYQSAAAPWPLQGCMAVTNDPNLDEDVTTVPAAISAVNLTYEVLCLVLTVIKTVGLRRGLSDSGIQMHLTHLLLRDGELHRLSAMTILGVLNIASATVKFQHPKTFPMGNNLNEAFSRSLVPMLTVRFIANLKNAGLEQSTYITQVDAVSTLRFSPPSERVFASVAGPLHLVTDKKEENTA
ncbi:hypothetical protein BV20DRAFT_952893 [Pilatotrama ljubarskyi]|nr:hypothetical protein BV20DRAFT_952893 [Pilatotrama ljubarskyi]